MVAQVRSWWRSHPALGWGAVFILAAALVVGVFVLPAMADTQVLNPDGLTVTGANAWSTTGAEPVLADANAGTYYSATTDDAIGHASLQNATGVIPAGAVITSIRVDYRAYATVNDRINMGIRIGGADNWGATGAVNLTAADAPYNETWTGTWSVADLDSLELAYQKIYRANSTDTVRLTQAAVTVTYTPPVTVAVGDGVSLATPVSVATGQADVVVDSFTLTSSAGGTVDTVTVTKTGAAAVSALDIYSDANGNGLIDGADASVGSGAFGAPITISRPVSATPASYLVVADIDAAAADGSSVTGRVTAATGTGVNAFTYDDATSRAATVVHTVVAIGDGAALGTPVTVAPGDADVVVDAFTLSRSQGVLTPSVSTVTVTKTGTAAVSALDIYSDANGNGLIDGADASVGSGTFGAAITISQTVDATKSYLVVADIDPSAADGSSVTGRVTAAAGTSLNSFTYGDTASRTANVAVPATAVTIGNGTGDPGPADVLPDATGVVVDRFRIERTSGTQAATVDTVTVTRTGAAPVSSVKIYTDVNGDGSAASESLLGSAVFAGMTASVDIAPNQAVGAAGVSSHYLVVFDIGPGTDGQQTSAAVTSATGSGTPVPTFAYSDTGNTFTVRVADTQAPSVPANLLASAGGSSPVIATLTWDAATDNVAVTGYRIFRASSDAGPFAPIGTSASPTYSDSAGVTGQDYWYKVAAYDAAGNESAQSAASGPVRATWTPAAAPHTTYDSASRMCDLCHAPHRAATQRKIFKATTETPGETGVCLTCHDGSSATGNVKTGPASFGQGTGHVLEAAAEADDADLTNVCSSCHSPHGDFADPAKSMLPRGVVNGVTIGTGPNALCLACHDAANSWYGAGYPAVPAVDATGYPTLGTFATVTATSYVAYTDTVYSAHLSIPAASGETTRSVGDCLYCHASHSSASAYDDLVARFQPPTVTDETAATYDDYATLCFRCHGTEPGGVLPLPVAGATNIQQFVTAQGSGSGHRIKTAGGTYDVGAPLPCYECHNPHGSARSNRHLFSDALGGSLDTTTVAGGEHLVREFCFTCHTTAGSASGGDGVAYAWDSASSTYVAAPAGSMVAGLARDASVGANAVRLPEVNGHYRDDAQSCYACHGDSYAPSGSNVHNPSGGISQGGEACYNCHTEYQAYMEDGRAVAPQTTKVGADRQSVYHHVLGGVASDGDLAPADDAGYPTGTADGLRCVTCHVDHDKFNSSPGANLRVDSTTNAPVVATNTDYDPAAFGGGLCAGCHTFARTRNGLNEKAATSPTQKVTSPGYDASSHQYKVSSEFGAGNTFLADCSKCHNDEQVKEFQTSANSFGTHWSAERSILTALGGAASDPMGETHCYGCHTGGTAGADGYGVRPDYGTGAQDMTAEARSTEAQFGLLSKHPVVPTGSGAGNVNSVECANCHNPHLVSSASKLSDPNNTYNAAAYTSVDDKSAFCLNCHSSAALPTYFVDGATLRPSTVTIAAADQGAMDKSGFEARGHWSANGSISAGERVACGSCHDKHGSNAPKLLGQYDPATGTNKIGAETITASNNAVCYGCHATPTSSFPAGEAQREAGTGYLADGTWPGRTMFSSAYVAATHSGSPHTTASWPASGLAAGDCKNCHDVHGTANTYDVLRPVIEGGVPVASFGADNYKLCFTCHGAGGSGSDIQALYPVATGGMSTGERSGHRVLSAVPGASLAQNDAVPCYDCHNAHGSPSSYSLQVGNVGDEAADAFDFETVGTRAQNVRNFCFTCHVPSDSNEGWGDTGASAGWIALTTETVEGIQRTNAAYKLKLPTLDDHMKADNGDCLACHTSPHEPSGGVSNGEAACYGCHTSYRETMDADGTSRTLSYHHVMGTGGGTYSGDTAFASGSYPPAGSNVFCLSCHVDHNLFNASKAGNLRTDMAATPVAASTDYQTSGNYGVCVSCHGAARAKDRTNQANDGLTGNVPAIGGAAFGSSSHQYAVTSSFDDASTFSANCVKCHDDENDLGSYQSGTAFGPHYSQERRILAALGATLSGALSENHCYGCHTGDTLPRQDFYGTKAMTTQASVRVETAFSLTSHHPVEGDGSSTRTVECVNCHNAHTVSGTNPVSDPANTYNPYVYSTDAQKTAYCITCHDGSAPVYTVGAAYVPASVIVVNPSANKSANAARAHWSSTTISSSIDAGQEVTCAECHDNHGSQAPKLLGIYDPSSNTNKIGTVTVADNNNAVCEGCHTSATPTAFAREAATGYPIEGTWPGMSVYTNASTGIHRNRADADASDTIWPGSTYADGDCKNCHDVHGTANAYDELRGTYTESNFGTCFECHDGGPATINIKQFYPVAAGGSSSATNAGHKVKASGSPLTGKALPCYDCHNPHGSAEPDGLLVESMIGGTKYLMGDTATEIGDVTNAASCRLFCFLCHTTATGRGTNSAGTGYTAIAATDLVEGISRNPATDNNALKLSALAAHTEADGRSCLTCHGGMTASNAVNVHSPSSGAGGGPCFGTGCHGSDSTERLEKMVSDATTYHHVLEASGADANTYDATPNTDEMRCLSCHVDHANFNTSAGNLRGAYNDTPSGASGLNSDFPGNGTYGVCISCHSTTQPKSGQGSAQKAGGSATTPAIAGAVYDASAHDYLIDAAAKVGYGSDAFRANCIKCHDDSATAPSTRQTGTYRLAPHYSAENRIAAALGVALAGTSTASEENLCYLCHVTAAQSATDAKTVAGRDAFDVTAMSAISESIYAQFQKTYRHPVGASAGRHTSDEGAAANWNPAGSRHAECEDCHNPHAAKSGVTAPPTLAAERTSVPTIANATLGVWGVDIDGNGDADWAGTGTFGGVNSQDTNYPTTYTRVDSATYQWQLCLKCHSTYAWGSTAPTIAAPNSNLQLNQTGSRYTDVGEDFNPKNYAVHPIFTVGKNQPTNATVTWVGGTNYWDTAAYARNINGTVTGNALSNTFLDGWRANSRVICTDCHNNNDTTGASGPHGSTQRWLLTTADPNVKVTYRDGTVVYPNQGIAAAAGASGNYCLNCHRADVYGFGNKGGASTDANAQNAQLLSRVGHRGGVVNNSCNNGAELDTQLSYSGCLNCHGGRKDTSSFGLPANTVVQSGAVHGTSMGSGIAGDDYTITPGDAMGIRFMNGASWGSHLLGDTSGNVGCSTLRGDGGGADNYSNCTQHDTTTSAPTYYYARPTN